MTMQTPSTVAEGIHPEWSLGDHLRKARVVAGYKDQQQFADLLGIARKSIFNYENDVTTPNLPVVEKWARVTGVSLDWLLGKGEGGEAARRPLRRRRVRRDLHVSGSTWTDAHRAGAKRIRNRRRRRALASPVLGNPSFTRR